MSNILKVRDAVTGEVSEIDLVQGTHQMRDSSGKVVKMDLSQADVHYDRPLATYASGFKLAGGIADQVCPVVATDSASNRYYTWDKDDVFQAVDGLVSSPGGAVKEVSPRLSSSAYATVPYAIGAFIPTEVEQNSDAPLNVAMQAMRRCMNVLLAAREVRVATMLKLAGNYGASYKATLGATANWNGGSTSNPVQDIFNRMEATLAPVTAMAMSSRTYHDFIQNAVTKGFTTYKDSVGGLPSPSEIVGAKALLGLPPILVCDMKTKGATTGTYDYVWGNDVVFIHSMGAGFPSDGQSISSAYTFRWNGGPVGDAQADGGFVVRSFFNPVRGPRGGRQIVVTHNDAEQFITDVVGGLIIGAHQ